MAHAEPPLDTALTALGTHRRNAVALLATARREQWHLDLVEAALTDLAAAAHHYRDSWAAVKVDTDRQVRAASTRALYCGEHGHMIDTLERQLHQTHRDYRAAEQARRTYLQGVHNIADALTLLQGRIRRSDPDLPKLSELVDTLADLLAAIQHDARPR